MSVAQAIFPIFALILLGYGLRRWFRLSDDFWPQLDRLIYYVFFPALLFHSLSGFQIDLGAATPMLEVAILYMLAGMALGYVAKYLFHAPPKVFAASFQSSFRFNSYVGLAVAGAIHGQDGLAAIGLLMGFLVPMANVAAVWALARHGEGHWLKEILFNPLIMATAGGIFFSLAGLHLPDLLQRPIALLSQASLPMGLIAVGAGLKLQSLNRYRRTLWYGVLVKLLVLPAIAWGLASVFGLTGVYFHIAVLMAALPVSTVSYVLAMRMGGDGSISAAQVMVTTLLAMVTLPMWLLLMGF
ncbi:auxin efflux carrier [Sulfuricella denitrificans skB26]|uniref:Auxin efflux carrier n=1 Tax=Sulfuricella denitrificans (strain DSM 22764 / NBRC 105220 / skB26) TaxID=1163617 RepID=S6B4Y0_SULDS|nr:AEC family transporter [Sulfuricella denitrificans]BAN35627.1 auxin efflux carrier [Sulfuricella denitrificans skB26]